jgi:hypothetical protein
MSNHVIVDERDDVIVARSGTNVTSPTYAKCWGNPILSAVPSGSISRPISSWGIVDDNYLEGRIVEIDQRI